MKKQILIAGLILVSAVSFGQKKEIKKAEKAIQSKNFTEATAQLKAAESLLSSADTDVQAKFYATQGKLYLESSGNDFSKMKMSADAFIKALELDKSLATQLDADLTNLKAKLVNSAIKDQDANKLMLAADKLYSSYKLSPVDTSYLFFAANNSYNSKEFDKALTYYQTLVDLGYTGISKDYVATNKSTGVVESFDSKNLRDMAVRAGEYIKPDTKVASSRKSEILRSMTYIYLEKGDNEKAQALIQEARAESPNDTALMSAEADLAYKTGDIKRYDELMSKVAESDPDNPEIFLNLGIASAQIGNTEKAVEYYEKALKLNPEYERVLINLAALKLSKDEELVKEMNELGTSSADYKKYDELKQQRQDNYKETLPYLEKAYKLNPNNPDVVTTLMSIYGQIGDDANFKIMKAKLQELGQ